MLPKRYMVDSITVDVVFYFPNKGIKFELGQKRGPLLTHTAQFVAKGAIRVDMPDFTATSYAGQNITYYPWKDRAPYVGDLTVTLTAVEPSLYICLTKEGFTANQNLVTVPESGTYTVQPNTAVCGTQEILASGNTYKLGDVFLTTTSTEVTSTPGSVLNLVTFT